MVNLSYWIFPAIADLGVISAEFPSSALTETGLALVGQARFGPSGLPANWISLANNAVTPARAFDKQFGYDAIRIPLYLAWLPGDHAALLESFERAWDKADESAVEVVDLDSGEAVGAMSDPGYRAVVDLVRCSLNRPAPAQHIRDFSPTDYYPSTLHLLSLLAMAERYPRCLANQ